VGKMNYDIVFNKNGNGRFKKTRFPDGESLITILSDVKGKEILYITDENMPVFELEGSLDWIFTISACISGGAKKVDVLIRFENQKDLAKKFVESVGANVVKGKTSGKK